MPIKSSFIYEWPGLCNLQNQVEANWGWLWVPEEVLWESDGREQAVAERGSGTESTETFPTVLHANDPTHHPHHVPLMWACRGPSFLIVHGRRGGPPDGPCSPTPTPGPHQPVGHRTRTHRTPAVGCSSSQIVRAFWGFPAEFLVRMNVVRNRCRKKKNKKKWSL